MLAGLSRRAVNLGEKVSETIIKALNFHAIACLDHPAGTYRMTVAVPESVAVLSLASVSSNVMQMQSLGIREGKTQITARLPNTVVSALDTVARRLSRSRAEIVRRAVERYIEDFDDLSVAVERLRDPSDPVLDWDQVRRDLLDTD